MTALNFPELSELSTDTQALLSRESRDLQIPASETVIRIGEQVGGVYVITEGHLRVYVQSLEGREKTLYQVRAGQACILSVNSSFSGFRFPAWVESGSEGARGLYIPSKTYNELFETNRTIRDFTIRVLSGWILELMTMIEESTLTSTPERIAHWLVRRADEAGVVRATHEELANDLGTAREVVSRCLSEFEAKGWLGKERNKIQLFEVDSLLGKS